MKFDKRGNFTDVFDYSILLLFIGVLAFVGFIFFYNGIGSLNNEDVMQNQSWSNKTTSAINNGNTSFRTFDYVGILFYIGFLAFSTWAARLVDVSHKLAFLGVLVILLLTGLFFGIEIVWEQFKTSGNDYVSSFVSTFPITNFMLSTYRYWGLFYSFVVMVALYAKKN